MTSRGPAFTQVASGGFGDPQNSYAFSMAWYADDLFVGTVRNLLAMIAASPPRDPARMNPWPVPAPDDVFDLDLRAQIWRTDGEAATWDQAYVSPLLETPGQPDAPRDIGYRCMAVFQGASDPEPRLYVATAASNSRGRGAHVLQLAPDGEVTASGVPGLGDETVSTLRMLVARDDLLYTSPTGSGRAWNAADCPAVFATEDPLVRRWRMVSEPGFGDSDNDSLYAMAHFADHLYVGTLNPHRGYQVWKGRPTHRGMLWQLVVEDGAGRGPLNEAAMTMCVFDGCLYVGSGISNGGFDRTYGVGPAAGEIIRIFPDDRWELVVGAPRRTSRGELRPTSGLGPGFDNPCAGYIWSMAVHDGQLYVGTFDSTIFGLWADPRSQAQWNVEGVVDSVVAERAGAELWHTADGDHWSAVTTSGFGNPYNYGIRTLASSPHGLYAGTANPFGPDVAVRFAGGWQFAPNPAGGAEVWLVGADRVPAGRPPSPPTPTPYARASVSLRTRRPASAPEPPAAADPMGLGLPESVARRFFRGTEFRACGSWRAHTDDPVEACRHQLDELLHALPSRARTLLDLSAAPLATTPYLATHLSAVEVTGVLGSVAEQRRSPSARRVRFVVGNPGDLPHPDAVVGAVDAVVALQGLRNGERAQWLASAHQQLQPGGRLGVADLLLRERDLDHDVGLRYRQLLLDAGFRDIDIEDVTAETWLPFVDQLVAHLTRETGAGLLPPGAGRRLTRGLMTLQPNSRLLLVFARKV